MIDKQNKQSKTTFLALIPIVRVFIHNRNHIPVLGSVLYSFSHDNK